MKLANEKQIKEIEILAKNRLAEILNTESSHYEGKNTYYVDSQNGCDENDGKSPNTAWRSLSMVGTADLKYGDVVLFRRGCVFRGHMDAVNGVTYSAYGEGEKPCLYGSINASDPHLWVPTRWENVWKFRDKIAYVHDVGNIFFGENDDLWGVKVCENTAEQERCDMGNNKNCEAFNGRQVVHRERGKWNGPQDLKGDLEYLHCIHDEFLYLYCAEGNPAKVFGKIELSLRQAIVNAAVRPPRDITFDNICFKYSNFGIGLSTTYNLTVRNCVFGCIGGSSMFVEASKQKRPSPYNSHDVTRYGNAIEIYGVCENMVVENCYFYQIYDAAITSQVHIAELTEDSIMNGVVWRNNLFDKCHYSFELWLCPREKSTKYRAAMRNVDLSGNICLNNGYGHGNTRGDRDDCFIYSGGFATTNCEYENCHITDNVFFNGRITNFRGFNLGNEALKFYNNKIYSNALIATTSSELKFGCGNFKNYEPTDENLNKFIESGIFGDNEYLMLEKDDSSFEPIIKL